MWFIVFRSGVNVPICLFRTDVLQLHAMGREFLTGQIRPTTLVQINHITWQWSSIGLTFLFTHLQVIMNITKQHPVSPFTWCNLTFDQFGRRHVLPLWNQIRFHSIWASKFWLRCSYRPFLSGLDIQTHSYWNIWLHVNPASVFYNMPYTCSFSTFICVVKNVEPRGRDVFYLLS